VNDVEWHVFLTHSVELWDTENARKKITELENAEARMYRKHV